MGLRSLRGFGLLATFAAGCFSGAATIGAVCTEDGDCGDEQVCRHEICGRCGDGVAQTGEMCFDDPRHLADVDAERLQSADVDGDGRLDVLAVTGSTVAVHLVTGDGSLEPQPTVDVGAPITATRTGDVDGDGLVDVAFLAGTELLVGWGDGAGGLDVEPLAAAEGGAVAVANRHLVVASDVPQLRWWTVAADRTIGDPTVVTLDAGGPVLGPAAAFDDDERLDVVVATDDGALTVWAGTADGFSAHESEALDVVPSGVAVADLQGDGRPDAMVLDASGQRLVLAISDGQGRLVPEQTLEVAGPPVAAVALDLTRDNLRDLVVAVSGRDELAVFVARGREYPDRTALAVGSGVRDVIVTNLDATPGLELVVATDEGVQTLEGQP